MTPSTAARQEHDQTPQIRFGDLTGAARSVFESLARPRRWKHGQTIIRQGAHPGGAFIVRTGRVRLRTIGADGNERVIGWFRPGTVGALASVIAALPFPCDVVADGDCLLDHVDGGRLESALSEHPDASIALARLMAARVVIVTGWYAERSSAPLATRVEHAIHRLHVANVGAREPDPEVIRITQEDLARSVGASRYRVGIVLRKMRDEGQIALIRGAIVRQR